jgi:universal stress protein A
MPFRPSKILVATDFSKYAKAAADAAGVMARAFEGRITLLHVVPLSVYLDVASHMEGRLLAMEDYPAKVLQLAQQHGEKERSRLRAEGVECELMTVDGTPPTEIVKVAGEGHFDLVVIGTHGRTGLMHLAMGSVAESVVRLCPVPVLVVRVTAAIQASESKP